MLYRFNNEEIETLDFYGYSDLKGKEKDLENLLAKNLGDLFIEDGQLMPIFQERQWQEEPDLCALDKNGNLVIFELKRGKVQGDTTIQVMRYSQYFGQKKYQELNDIYHTYSNSDKDLRIAHAEAFGFENFPLKEEQFNNYQKLIIVGNSLDKSLIDAVDYWKEQGIDIDFLPYRFYKINGEMFFEFFAKPYDYHINPKDKKGVLFDTNKSWSKTDVWEMFSESKISAYGNAAKCVSYLNKGDYVFYYHIGWGVIGAGIVKSPKPIENEEKEELYQNVDLLTPCIEKEEDIRCISPSELSSILGKGFYYANTIKKPYLSSNEAKQLVDELKRRYNV